MKIEEVTFHSDGLRLNGSFYLPDDLDPSPHPLVLACSGFTGLNRIHPARFARYLTAHGHLCFGFDYRGFAASEGERNRVVLEEQVRDVIFALSFAAGDARVDARKIYLLGWGMGAGIVLDAARQHPWVAGLILANGFYNGARVQVAHRGEQGFEEFRQQVCEQLTRQATTGQRERMDPFDIYPLDDASREYVDSVLKKTPDYDTSGTPCELGDSIVRWNPEAHAPHLRVPLLVTHGDQNTLHPTAEAQSLYDCYGGPKQLYWLAGAGHTEFMHDDDPRFQALARRIDQWLCEQLGRG